MAISILEYYVTTSNLIDSALDDTIQLTAFIANEMRNPMYNLDVDKLNDIIDNLEQKEGVSQALVLFPDGRVLTDGSDNDYYGLVSDDDFLLTSLSSDTFQTKVIDDYIRISMPIYLNEPIGFLAVDYSLTPYYSHMRDSLFLVFGISSLLLGIFIPLTILISGKITRPILRLKDKVSDISEGNFSQIDEHFDTVELQELSDGINDMQKKLRDYQQDLINTERLSTIGELSARIAHDLRNPLTTMKNAVELIKTKNPELVEKNLQYFDWITSSIDNINTEINDVLIHVKTQIPEKKLTPFGDILEQTLSQIIIPKNISLIKPKENPEIYCDKFQINNVLTNLIINAIQSIDGNEGRIVIGVTSDTDYHKITIFDDGPGISDDLIDSIFEPLFTTKSFGTGLGLVNCKNAVVAHGGKISVKNLENGVEFTILLPKK